MLKNKKYKICMLYMVCILAFLLCGCGKKEEEVTTQQQVVVSTEAMPVTTTEAPLATDEDGFVVTEDYVKTISDGVNVRIEPRDDSPIYRILAEEVIIPRTGYNDKWTRIIVDNTAFFVDTKLVAESQGPEESANDENDENTEDEEAEPEPLKKVIVIDPGKQAQSNAATEPIGPNSETLKDCVGEGVKGDVYDTEEAVINLIYAKLLKAELQKRGYTVALTREENDVNISNKERAEFANGADATVFIRINMNYSQNSELNGIMAVTMTSDSEFNSDLYEESNKLARRILQGAIEDTGAENQGILESNEFTAINWSEIPVVDIRLGYLSNPDNETKLVSEEYQSKLVNGIADGIDYYFTIR